MIIAAIVLGVLLYILIGVFVAGYLKNTLLVDDAILAGVVWGVWVPIYVIFVRILFPLIGFFFKPIFRLGEKFQSKSR